MTLDFRKLFTTTLVAAIAGFLGALAKDPHAPTWAVVSSLALLHYVTGALQSYRNSVTMNNAIRDVKRGARKLMPFSLSSLAAWTMYLFFVVFIPGAMFFAACASSPPTPAQVASDVPDLGKCIADIVALAKKLDAGAAPNESEAGPPLVLKSRDAGTDAR